MKPSTKNREEQLSKVMVFSTLPKTNPVRQESNREYVYTYNDRNQVGKEKPKDTLYQAEYTPRDKHVVNIGYKSPVFNDVPHAALHNQQQKRLNTRPKSTQKLEVKRLFRDQQHSTHKIKVRVQATETKPKKSKPHIKVTTSNTLLKQKSLGIKIQLHKRNQRVSFSQRVLENEQLLEKLAQKYTDVQEQISVKGQDLLAINSKLQSNTRTPSEFNEQVLSSLRASVDYWEQLESTLNIEICCKIVGVVAELPQKYADFENYKWAWIVFLLVNRLSGNYNQEAESHLQNLVGYCKSNYYLHLTNTLEDLQLSLSMDAVLVLTNRKQMPLFKRLQHIDQNQVVIQSIITMLVESYQQGDIKERLINQKTPKIFNNEFYLMWRSQGLCPILPPASQQHLYTFFVDLDNTLIFRHQGTVTIRPFSKEMIENIYRYAEIIVFTRLSTQQLRSVVTQLALCDPFTHILYGLKQGKSYPQTISLLNRDTNKLCLVSPVKYNRNSLVVNKWNGSEYDNQLMSVLALLEEGNLLLHL